MSPSLRSTVAENFGSFICSPASSSFKGSLFVRALRTTLPMRRTTRTLRARWTSTASFLKRLNNSALASARFAPLLPQVVKFIEKPRRLPTR